MIPINKTPQDPAKHIRKIFNNKVGMNCRLGREARGKRIKFHFVRNGYGPGNFPVEANLNLGKLVQ